MVGCLFSFSEPQGICYIETASLDGETNLKIRKSLPETSGMMASEQLLEFNGTVECEAPNRHVYEYNGLVRPHGEECVHTLLHTCGTLLRQVLLFFLLFF